jgi:hypothetical protein
MVQRGELHLPVLSRLLSHPGQDGGHAMIPALRPGRAILVRVPLGRVPSLRLLLGPRPQGQVLVRRFL